MSGCDAAGRKQYPADFRDRLRRPFDAGLAQEEAAPSPGAALASRPGRPQRLSAAGSPALAAQRRAAGGATLAEHRDRWAAIGVRVSPATMSRPAAIAPRNRIGL